MRTVTAADMLSAVERTLTPAHADRMRAELAFAFCTVLWGATFVVVKNSLDHSSVFVFLAVRFSLAGLCMAIFRPEVLRAFEREQLFAGIRLGFFMFGGYAFQTAGLRYTTASNSGFITGTSVVLVPLILALFWGRRVTLWVCFGTFAAATGLYFLTVPVAGVAHLNRGDVLTFFAAGSYAVHIILVGEYTKEHSAAALSVLQGAGLRADVLADGFWCRCHPLATDAFRITRSALARSRRVRRVCHGRRIFTAVMGAAVHHAEPRGDPVYAGAGLRCSHFLCNVG